jgi:uncharacterized membrane protein YraQ (UPF0718 family)
LEGAKLQPLGLFDLIKGILVSVLSVVTPFLAACWEMLVEMAPYMCLGFLMAGLLHVFVNPRIIIRFLGKGRIKSVLYATLLGIPLPLCSCGVLPATAGLKKQGATDGAAMSFMIATPETGVDSMAVTYALLDPIMTIFRPVAAFFTSVAAGLTQNFFGKTYDPSDSQMAPDLSCKIDNCCDGIDCPPEVHRLHHNLIEKLNVSFRYGFGEILDDISKWLILGIAIAGAISVLVPYSFMQTYLGGGISSMLIMLVVGIPFYTCATASTPIAAALIIKGVSPGAALVFLLAGPATNAATISVVYGLFRKRATLIYLACISLSAILMGLLLDRVYGWFEITAASVAGEAGELIPHWMGHIFAILLAILIINSLWSQWRRKQRGEASCCDHGALASGRGREHGALNPCCGGDHVHVGTPSPDRESGCDHDHSKPSESIRPRSGIKSAPIAKSAFLPIAGGSCNCSGGSDAPGHSHPDIENADAPVHALEGGPAGCGHERQSGNSGHDHSHDHKADGQDPGAKEVLKNPPHIVAEELVNLKEENSRLRKILVQRDLEIYAMRNQQPQKN